jgi:hypothetical protein
MATLCSKELESANGNQIARNNHWITDFPLFYFDLDQIFNIAAIKGHTFAWDP